MNITIKEMLEKDYSFTIKLITELFNFHRSLLNSSKEFYQTDKESEETLENWLNEGKVYNILSDNEIVGFFYVRFGGQKAAWLEDLYISEQYRKQGIGKIALNKLDDLMVKNGILAMFVDVIPRNTQAIKFYQECGFDHLNMIQLRKNYDKKLDKDETVDLIGYTFKKY